MRWRWVAGAAAVLLVLTAGTLWLLFQHIPSWYRPVQLAPAQIEHVKRDLEFTFDSLSTRLAGTSGPFEYRLTEEQLNGWLAAREAMWPLSREWLPPELSNPAVVLARDEVRLAATFRQGSIQTVLSVRLGVTGDASGIRVRLLGVSGGSLSVPEAWIREQLVKVDSGGWPAGRTAPFQHGDKPLPALTGLLEGVTFTNTWVWENGKQPFRINWLRAEAGALVAELEPLPRQQSRR